ncbi:hypothetical protein BN871_AL_00060 [Paenibacillus sp. P22]|nr:hypothetical protein BN871_AL_00060 [Paenibacillus sp. P22]
MLGLQPKPLFQLPLLGPMMTEVHAGQLEPLPGVQPAESAMSDFAVRMDPIQLFLPFLHPFQYMLQPACQLLLAVRVARRVGRPVRQLDFHRREATERKQPLARLRLHCLLLLASGSAFLHLIQIIKGRSDHMIVHLAERPDLFREFEPELLRRVFLQIMDVRLDQIRISHGLMALLSRPSLSRSYREASPQKALPAWEPAVLLLFSDVPIAMCGPSKAAGPNSGSGIQPHLARLGAVAARNGAQFPSESFRLKNIHQLADPRRVFRLFDHNQIVALADQRDELYVPYGTFAKRRSDSEYGAYCDAGSRTGLDAESDSGRFACPIGGSCAVIGSRAFRFSTGRIGRQRPPVHRSCGCALGCRRHQQARRAGYRPRLPCRRLRAEPRRDACRVCSPAAPRPEASRSIGIRRGQGAVQGCSRRLLVQPGRCRCRRSRPDLGHRRRSLRAVQGADPTGARRHGDACSAAARHVRGTGRSRDRFPSGRIQGRRQNRPLCPDLPRRPAASGHSVRASGQNARPGAACHARASGRPAAAATRQLSRSPPSQFHERSRNFRLLAGFRFFGCASIFHAVQFPYILLRHRRSAFHSAWGGQPSVLPDLPWASAFCSRGSRCFLSRFPCLPASAPEPPSPLPHTLHEQAGGESGCSRFFPSEFP